MPTIPSSGFWARSSTTASWPRTAATRPTRPSSSRRRSPAICHRRLQHRQLSVRVRADLGRPVHQQQHQLRRHARGSAAAGRPAGDLIATQAPNYSGEQTTVSWTVTNEGAVVWSGTRYWVDHVYFSNYPTLDQNRDPLVGEFPHSNDQPLGSQASYTQSATFTLPPGIGGTAANPQTFYVYVITGYYDALTSGSRDNDGSRSYFTTRGYEDPTNNQSSATLRHLPRARPRGQQPGRADHAAASGDTIPVTFTVTNIGNRDTRTASGSTASTFQRLVVAPRRHGTRAKSGTSASSRSAPRIRSRSMSVSPTASAATSTSWSSPMPTSGQASARRARP